MRTQLTAVFAALLVVGLGLSGVVAYTLLERSLTAQLDAQLTTVTPVLLDELGGGLPQRGRADDTLPSDYVVVVNDADGGLLRAWSAGTAPEGAPDLTGLTLAEVVDTDGEPFTVRGPAQESWRVLAQPLARPDGRLLGSVAVALPLGPAHATLDRMRTSLVLIGVAVVGLGALAGRWAVRRSLRQLNEIEATAAAIAAGDLTRRVPGAAPGTEVGHLADSLNVMLGHLERSFDERAAAGERMRRFVADAGHELRTPLATIRGYGELYRMGAVRDDDDLARTFRRIEDSAARMGVLVEDLMHLARLDEGRPLARDEVDLAVLAADAAADLRALDPTRTVALVPLTPGASTADAVVAGDESRLRQVLANLVGNAARHTPDGTPVEIAVGRLTTDGAGGTAVVEVRDHGPGIPAEHAARVFERFYRVDAGRSRDHGGTGLGLAIVDAIVRAHGGTVSLVPTSGGGATARIALPAAPPSGQDAPSEDDGAAPEEVATQNPDGGGRDPA
nr:HAMP domain-containing sensor histidine kinase [Cellulomonas sp. APG4]